jgi:site-specific recombinase XerD
LRLVEQGDLAIPDGVDVATFVVSDGRLTQPVSVQQKLHLEELFRRYHESLPNGAMEENSLYTVNIHLNHCLKVFGRRCDVSQLTNADLQRYVRQRSKEKGRSDRPVSATTIKKELTSFSGVWTWAKQTGIVDGPFPNKGIRYPKTDEKPPFQTWSEIET